MKPAKSRRAWVAAGRAPSASAAAVVLAVAVMGTAIAVAPAANADRRTKHVCAGELGDPVGPSTEWDEADLDNRHCAVEGLRMIQNNPAVAAATAANAAAGVGHFLGDPFRAPHRWAGTRGSYELTTFTDSTGNPWSAALFGPRKLDRGPYPGVLLVCHICPLFPTTEYLSSWYWAAERSPRLGTS